MSDRQPTFIEAIEVALNSVQSRMRTAIPAKVVSYRATPTPVVSVMPVVMDETGGKPARVDEVPVVFPQGGGYTFTWPLKPGDDVMLLVSDRPIDRWQVTGSVAPKGHGRMHSLTDAVAFPGPSPDTNPPAGVSATDLTIFGPGGEALRLTPAGDMSIGGPGGPAAARVGDTISASPQLVQWMLAVEAALDVAMSPIAPGLSAAELPPAGLGLTQDGALGTIQTGSGKVSCL